MPAHPPIHIQTKCPCRAALWSPTAVVASGLLLINTQPQCQHKRECSNAEPRDEKGVGGYILVGLVALTRLLSYSFLEAAKSWALEIAIPQKGRYICSTCGHIEVSEKLQTSVNTDLIDQRWSQNYCYYIHTLLLSCSQSYNVKALVVYFLPLVALAVF